MAQATDPAPIVPRTQPLRVLFVTHSFPPEGRPLANVGGMQRVATELHEELSRHPRVSLSTLALRSTSRWYELRTFPFLVRLLFALPGRVRREGADVVLFSSMVTAVMAPMMRSMPGVKLAAIAHGRDVTLPVAIHQRVWLPPAFRRLDAILPVSTATADACLERGAEPRRIQVVPNGIDADRFSTLPPRSPARNDISAQLSLPHDSFLLVAVGRQVKRKGLAWFVANVLPRVERAHLAIAGQGPEIEPIEEAAIAAGLTNRVHLLGRIGEADLRRLLAAGDLFVMPNIPVAGDMEGFGVVMLEAGLAGLPALASDLEGIRDVVREGVSGHLVPPLDAGAFANLIRRYDTDREGLASLASSTRDHVRRTFTWPAVADQYVGVLERLTDSSGTASAGVVRTDFQDATTETRFNTL